VTSGSSLKLIRAAEYVRMSTDHQKYSTSNQSATNLAYAACHGMEIVRAYLDEGRSGLRLEGRDALKTLIRDVQSGFPGFSAILVYDVSRWGRFQDADEAAHYEYLCKRAGITVHYCAERFENDGTPLSAIFKAIKRAMAAEYSRELSVKVLAGQRRSFENGYHQGGAAPFGMRRLLVTHDGAEKAILSRGEHKSLQSDRVVLVPGPLHEIATINWIFSEFVQHGRSESEIVETLNQRNIDNGWGRPWSYVQLRRLLQNEIYVSKYVWNRLSRRLGRKPALNPCEDWLQTQCQFKPLVDPHLFTDAQAIFQNRKKGLSNEEKLLPLRRLLAKYGYLSDRLIRDTQGVPAPKTYLRWFGGLRQAYELVNFKAKSRQGRYLGSYRLSNDAMLKKLHALLARKGVLSEHIINRSKTLPAASTYRKRFGSLVNAYRAIGFTPLPSGTPKIIKSTCLAGARARSLQRKK
jgi:DNA invertase Pin-like site-specific DNA recombinase